MENDAQNQFQAQRWLFIFVFIHLIFWTFIPVVVRQNLPLDAIEGTIWGAHLEFGYDKNPFLNGWLTGLAVFFSQPSGWMIYLFSQLCVTICFLSIWQLAKKMLPPIYALISVLLLEGIQYFNIHAIDFNDNTLELALWALSILFFYKSVRSSKSFDWMMTGALAGLGMMAKYYTAVLLASMLLYLLSTTENRKQLTTLPPYLGLATFIGVILPHLIWLFFHDFITVTYVFARASSHTYRWINHFFYPLHFTWQQLQVFIPAILLFSGLFIGKQKTTVPPLLSKEDRNFLLFVGLGPFLLTILLSFLLDINLRAGWGMPLQSLWGIILVATFRPQLTRIKMLGFLASIFTLMGILLSGYALSIIHSNGPSTANFPGRQIAETITKRWHDTYHTPLAYVAGSRWVGGNIEFYSSDHPSLFINLSQKQAPWINLKTLQQKGAVFVWHVTENESPPADIQQHFPQLLKYEVLNFPWQRNKKHLQPIQIGIAMLPPQEKKEKKEKK